MRTETNGAHHRVVFDSFADLISYSEAHDNMANAGFMGEMRREFNGANSVAEACQLAKAGLPLEGLEALALSEVATQERDDLISQQFQPYNAVSGGDVDVALYLTGEPECMVDYWMEEQEKTQRIVTLVLGAGIRGQISDEALRKNGQALLQLAEAIERTGSQTEIWADHTSKGNGYTGRISVLLKRAGEPFDAGLFMYYLTHKSAHRALAFNARGSWRGPWKRHIGIGGGTTDKALHLDDYPEGAIYIPSITSDSQAGVMVDTTLKTLGLVKA